MAYDEDGNVPSITQIFQPKTFAVNESKNKRSAVSLNHPIFYMKTSMINDNYTSEMIEV